MRLRDDVRLTVIPEGVELFDTLTGFRVAFEGGEAQTVCRREGPPGLAPWNSLQSLGMLEESLGVAEITARQIAFRRDALQDGRLGQIKELLDFVVTRVPYFRDRADVYRPEKIETVADLARLPLMRKAELRMHFPHGLVAEGVDVPAGIASGSFEIAATSGTTSERVQVLADLELDSVPANFEALWKLAPSQETPKTAVFTTPLCLGTECHLGVQPFEKRLRGDTTLSLNSLGDLFSMSRRFVEAVAGEMHRFAPDFLLVNPMYLHWLARKAREFDIVLPKPRLILSSYQYLSAVQRRALQSIFGAPVVSYYHATDLGGCRLGVECHRGVLHVREDHVVTEIVGADGPKPRGQLGAVVETAIANRVMPAVRYLVGDVARFSDETCDCAVAEWQTIELHGRMKDLCWFDGHWVTTREIDTVVSAQPGIDFYKCIQGTDGSVTIEVVPSLEIPLHVNELKDRVASAFKVRSVNIKEVKRLEPEQSMKFRLTQTQWRETPEFL